MPWMQRLQTYHHGLPSQNTPFRHTSITSQGTQKTATPGQALDTAEKIEKEETSPDYSLDIVDIAAPPIVTCTKAAPDHSKGMGATAVEATQGDPIQHTEATVTEPAMTHHTG